MPDKKIGLSVAFLLIAAALGLSAIVPEADYMHAPFHLMALAVVALSFYMSVMEIMILVFIAAGVTMGMAQMRIMEQFWQLVAETGVLLFIAMVLGWYEANYKEEHHKKSLINSYKRDEIAELRKKIAALNADNHGITEQIKEIRKIFV